MTATERLRQLLDERGVEWRGGLPTETVVDAPIDVLYVELPDGVMRAFIRSYLTPEQAVEATLGRGTCKVVSKPCDMWECECGKAWWHGGAPSYCPSCGRVAVLATPTDNATLSDLFGIWKEDE